MNIFTKFLIVSSFISSGYTIAQQQDNIKILNIPNTINKNYSFSGDWVISNNGSIYNLHGEKLINNSNKTSESLYLDLYFVPVENPIQLNQLSNKLTSGVRLGKLDGNGSNFSNITITFKDEDIKNLAFGNYTPIVVLKDELTDKVLNYKVIDSKANFEKINNDIETIVETETFIEPSIASQNNIYSLKKNANILDNIYTTVESSLEINDASKKLRMSGNWNLDIDFEKLVVTVGGENNSIENFNSTPTSNLKLLVYFSKEDIRKTDKITGFELLNFDIPPMKGYSRLNKPLIFTTNITKLIPEGEYYPILVLVEKNNAGEYVTKSTLNLGNVYRFGR